MKAGFTRLAQWASEAAGQASTFCLAVGIILVWAVTGPLFGFSDTWQLVVNTGTTIITFLMVFLIQHTQNTGDAALHAKLDALIAGCEKTSNRLIDLEHADPETVRKTKEQIVRDIQS